MVARGSLERYEKVKLRTLGGILIIVAVLFFIAKCQGADPFGGCTIHPGQCGRPAK